MKEPDLCAIRDQARELYRTPVRAYHNWDHIEQCLAEFNPVRGICRDARSVELAIWFHDCIYDPKRTDNEEKSAEAAADILGNAGLAQSFITGVCELIMDTRHSKPPTSADGCIITDVDLSILGRPVAEFDRYETAIRAEYAHVPDQAFKVGRSAILEAFLARPRIYLTQEFGRRYEQSARANLARSLARLGSSS